MIVAVTTFRLAILKALNWKRAGLLAVLGLWGTGGAIEARLGMTEGQWEAEYGKPKASGYYEWTSKERTVNFDAIVWELAPKWKDGRVVSVGLRVKGGREIGNLVRRNLQLHFMLEGDSKLTDYKVSEDRQAMLIWIVEPETAPKMELTRQAKPLLGLTTDQWQEKFGKPDDEGEYEHDGYRIKPQNGLKNGKIVWIRVRKISGEKLGDEELGDLFSSLTGKPKDQMKPGNVFEEGRTLIVTD